MEVRISVDNMMPGDVALRARYLKFVVVLLVLVFTAYYQLLNYLFMACNIVVDLIKYLRGLRAYTFTQIEFHR